MTYNENVFKIEFNNVPPKKGSVLISEPFSQDSYFQRSVVFLTEHTDNGSMGFVLNKSLDVNLNELIKGLEIDKKIPVFLGGPVNVDTLFYLHTLSFIPDSYQVTDTVYLNGDFDFLKEYINNGGDIDGNIKFFFGYSGWSENQLKDELSENSWLVSIITDNELLTTKNKKIWEKTLSSLGAKYKKWTQFPKNPTLN